MIIYLKDYQEDVAVAVCQEYNPRELELEFVDLVYLEKLKLSGTVEKGRETLRFQGRLASEVQQVCGRCLKKVVSRLDQPFQLYYEIKGLEQIDTTDDLRETLILNHPIRFVCREDCRGLCPQCGTDLNQKKCKCLERERKKANMFSPLKEIMEKAKEEKKHG